MEFESKVSTRRSLAPKRNAEGTLTKSTYRLSILHGSFSFWQINRQHSSNLSEHSSNLSLLRLFFLQGPAEIHHCNVGEYQGTHLYNYVYARTCVHRPYLRRYVGRSIPRERKIFIPWTVSNVMKRSWDHIWHYMVNWTSHWSAPALETGWGLPWGRSPSRTWAPIASPPKLLRPAYGRLTDLKQVNVAWSPASHGLSHDRVSVNLCTEQRYLLGWTTTTMEVSHASERWALATFAKPPEHKFDHSTWGRTCNCPSRIHLRWYVRQARGPANEDRGPSPSPPTRDGHKLKSNQMPPPKKQIKWNSSEKQSNHINISIKTWVDCRHQSNQPFVDKHLMDCVF